MYVSDFMRQRILPSNDLSTLLSRIGGGMLPPSGTIFFVDSNASTGADATGYGKSFDKPFLTIDYAIGQCTANAGDVILVAAGHNEGAGDAQLFDLDVAGVTILGMGRGNQRPVLDYDHANATIDIGANNCYLGGFRLRPSVTGVLIGVDIETGITGTVLEDIEWINGEDGSGTDEFVKALHLTSGNHDTVMRRLRIRAHVSAAHATHGIHVDAASDRCVYEDVVIDGPYATNGILEDAASADTMVRGCRIDVTGTGYGFVSTSTFAEFTDNRGNEGRLVNKLGQEFYDGLGFKVTKTEDVNTATSDDLFTLTGKVAIRLWTGEVTNALDTTVTDYQITLTTLAGVLVAAGNLSSAIVGHMFTLNSDAGDTSLSTSTSAVSVAGVGDTNGKTGHLVVGKAGGSDVIKSVRTAGAAGDAIRHDVFYMPLESGASLVAAA